ncbi:MAG: aminotransferase class V-fold PLP-dependent enzyme [Sphingopyxis sp.]|uniref:aminotransferase class V-fold PLP-dependent enzyme n=1 Tax=Sphingopyxis sp. TaxID=1908224 RepID=UPI002ABAB353|nr:aminotransferase class V-fold PLP-dependent enzyme [Sphingopyxis sp.]MDZ3830501.1 aminotransferase class V-fold PLP-dependent enzyme [Sphingopyxis sp.]
MNGAILPTSVAEGFHRPPGVSYLKSHSVGCLPRSAETMLHDRLFAPWAEMGEAWPNWIEAIDSWRGALGKLIGVEARDLCPAANVSAGLSRYLSALGQATDRRTILIAPSAFPTIGYVAGGLEAAGWTTRYLADDADARDPAIWAAALDENVALVIAMHVSSNSGARADIAGIAKVARSAGARCIADCAQSVGIVPVTPAVWDVDAVIGTSVKWLCGGPGAAWLWVAPHDRTVLMPMERGWWSHDNPFEMDIRDFRYASDARRWWGGTPDVAPFILSTAGIEAIAAIGIEAIGAHNRALQAALRGALEERTPQWRWPTGAIGGTLCIDTGTDQPHVAAKLDTHGIRADFRRTILRLSFHAYNDLGDVERTAAALA